MKKIKTKALLMLALAMFLLCLTFTPAIATDEKYYSQDGKFKIAFCGEPGEINQDQDSEFGKMTWFAYFYKTVEYLGIIMYCDLPKNMTLGIDSQEMIKQVGEGMVDSTDTIISENPITVSGISGSEFLSSKDNTITKRIVLMVGQRIYIYGIETTKDMVDSPKVEEFLNSFELLAE